MFSLLLTIINVSNRLLVLDFHNCVDNFTIYIFWNKFNFYRRSSMGDYLYLYIINFSNSIHLDCIRSIYLYSVYTKQIRVQPKRKSYSFSLLLRFEGERREIQHQPHSIHGHNSNYIESLCRNYENFSNSRRIRNVDKIHYIANPNDCTRREHSG